MAIRNFWIETNVDGRDTTDASGPKSKDGGFETTISVRHGGASIPAATIKGVALPNDVLEIRITTHVGREIVMHFKR